MPVVQRPAEDHAEWDARAAEQRGADVELVLTQLEDPRTVEGRHRDALGSVPTQHCGDRLHQVGSRSTGPGLGLHIHDQPPTSVDQVDHLTEQRNPVLPDLRELRVAE